MLVEWLEGGNGLNLPPSTPHPPLNIFQFEDISKVNQSKDHKESDIRPSRATIPHLLGWLSQP